MSIRIERFASTLKQSLADILLYEVNNPGLKNVSIARVDVSPDLKKARIYVFSERKAGGGDLVEQLTGARGFIKRILAKKMYLKYVPDLIFFNVEGKDLENGYEKEDR